MNNLVKSPPKVIKVMLFTVFTYSNMYGSFNVGYILEGDPIVVQADA